MGTIVINTDTMTNDQIAQLTAILSQSALAAYEQSEKPGDTEAAAKWAGHHLEHYEAASAAFITLLARVGLEEAADLCDQYGADPEFC